MRLVCRHRLELSVTADEWRMVVELAQAQDLSVSDFLRERLGMVAERDIPALEARIRRERAQRGGRHLQLVR